MSIVNLEPSGLLELCPGSNITFVCSTKQSPILVWKNYIQDHPDKHSHIYTAFSTGLETDSGSFALLLKSKSPLVLTATLKNGFSSEQNRTILACASTVADPTPSQTENATLVFKGIPVRVCLYSKWDVRVHYMRVFLRNLVVFCLLLLHLTSSHVIKVRYVCGCDK